jgi:SM-20-related protein
VTAFIDYLNQTCYTGINDFEFHYAFYEAGSFYQRHLDQFRADLGRKFSLVTYLNDNWSDDDGGKLSLYLQDRDVSIFPYGGRSVFFKSDEVEHEVHLAGRSRISIAGWLKRT